MMGGSSKGSKCSISSCINRCSQKNVRFFRFPNVNDHERLQKWKVSCNDEKIMTKDPSFLHSNCRICSVHFEEKFMQGSYLHKDAVPTLNLFQVPSAVTTKKSVGNYVEVGTQTEDIFKVNAETQTDSSQFWSVSIQTPKTLLPKQKKEKTEKSPQVKTI